MFWAELVVGGVKNLLATKHCWKHSKVDPSKDLATETLLATLKVDLSKDTGSVQEQYDTVLLGYLCVTLVDKSRFGFVGHYIKVTVGQLGVCL